MLYLLPFQVPPNGCMVAWLIDTRPINFFWGGRPTPGACTSFEQLGAAMALAKAKAISLFFTKLDISDMFHACKSPVEYAGVLMVS